MMFGLLAIGCWMLLLFAAAVFAGSAILRRRKAALLSAVFLLGSLAAGFLAGWALKPPALSTRAMFDAGLGPGGAEKYGHPIEHQAEVAIILATYAAVIGGGPCAGACGAAVRLAGRRRKEQAVP